MVKEEIVEGLKEAIARGESLNKAMMSFYNAGYPAQDIEEAAMYLEAPRLPQNIPVSQPVSKPTIPSFQEPETEQPEESSTLASPIIPQPSDQQEQKNLQQLPSLQQPQSIQKVSNYDVAPSPLGAVMIFVLVFFLLFLVGVLITAFLFKEELSGFFNEFL